MGNRLGQNVRNDHGIISGVHGNRDFDMCVASQILDFPKNLDFHLLRLKPICFFGRQICEAFIFLEYGI